MEQQYSFEGHTADVYIIGYGKTLKTAFQNTALGMQHYIVPSKNIDQKLKRVIKISAEDKEALLFDFLSEFVTYLDAEFLVFGTIKITTLKEINGTWELEAICSGEKFNPKKHKMGTAIKAITYHEMKFKKTKDGFRIKVLVDI